MRKRVLLLAVSCKTGGLCPGGIDLDNQNQWIRIVKDDGNAGAVQGRDIDFAKPLDVLKFEGRPKPQGRQIENWVIDNCSCKNCGRPTLNGNAATDKELLDFAYKEYSYHGFWGNYKDYLNDEEFERGNEPSESILQVTNVRIYKYYQKAKIDFNWSGARYRILGISMTDQDYYDKIDDDTDVCFDKAYIVVSIPKDCDWVYPQTGEKRAYKFVSRVFDISDNNSRPV